MRITAEVDLDDLATDDLINELADRLSKKGMKRMGAKERAKVMECLDAMSESSVVLIRPLFSIEDQTKKELIVAKWNQYTSSQFEQRLA